MRRISWCLIAVVVLALSVLSFQPTTRAQELPSPDPANRQLLSAESTGPHSFASLVDVAYGTVPWSNAPNAVACDGQRTEAVFAAPNYASHLLMATNASFSIPTTATVAGIEIKLVARASGAGPTFAYLRLAKHGALVGGSHTTYLVPGASDTTYTIGNSVDLWNAIWTPDDLNASDFGATVFVDATAPDTVAVDCLSATIYYLPYRLLLPLVSR